MTLVGERFSELYVCLFCTDSGDWTHECLDIVCADGVTVLTPFDVMLNQKAAPYINQPKKEPINNGTTLSGEGVYVHICSKG